MVPYPFYDDGVNYSDILTRLSSHNETPLFHHPQKRIDRLAQIPVGVL